MPTPREITMFRQTVYAYYHKHKRDLPWRQTTNPYHILVSEIMLQQTQVARAELTYHEFLRAFPTIQKLANAPLADVLRAWQGMGYNRRAKMLHDTANIVVHEYSGHMPRDMATLMTLPGIGPSTAGGICAYAYNIPVVFIETNIRRVYIHHFFSDKQGISDKHIRPLVETTLDHENPREWYSALMDYGTYLTTRVENPNRRSKHHVRQKPFKGSDREIRGAIIKILADRSLMEKELLLLPFERGRVIGILNMLCSEELIHKKGRRYSLGEHEDGNLK